MKNNVRPKKLVSLVLCAVLVCASLVGIVAADTVERADGVFVYDGAELIPDDAEADMNARATALEAMTGSKLTVVTVRTMGSRDSASFAPEVFDDLELSGGKDNSILIVFAAEEGYYHILPGKALAKDVDVRAINEVFDAALVPETSGNYGMQLSRMFDDLLERVEKIYSVDVADYDPSAASRYDADEKSERLTIGDYFMWVIILISTMFR